MIMPKLRGALRIESFDDKNGFHFAPGGAFATGQTKYKEVTATVSYLMTTASKRVQKFAAIRRPIPWFTDGASTSKTDEGAIQGLYKF